MNVRIYKVQGYVVDTTSHQYGIDIPFERLIRDDMPEGVDLHLLECDRREMVFLDEDGDSDDFENCVFNKTAPEQHELDSYFGTLKKPGILNDNAIVLDVGRPSLSGDEDFLKQGELHSWIKLNADNIRVCHAFYFIDDYINTKQKYGGGGFKYEFVMDDEETYCNFIKKCIEIWPQTARGVLKYRNNDNEEFDRLLDKVQDESGYGS